jgi:hypothetical protein
MVSDKKHPFPLTKIIENPPNNPDLCSLNTPHL